MTEPTEENEFARYEALRAELANLQRQFERAAERYHGLYHELIHAPESTLPRRVWLAFTEDNRAPEGSWEHWDLVPSLTDCGRFHGDGSGIEEFMRLAESSDLILRALERLATKGGRTPDSFKIKVPSEYGHHGWLRLLYSTARCYTALLRTSPSFWRHPEPVLTEEIENRCSAIRQ